MNKLTIAAVPVNLVEHMFPKAAPHLQRVVDKAPNDISLETIKANLMKGDTMLITISDGIDVVAVNVLQVHVMETGYRVLYIPITGGIRMEEWLDDFMEIAHALARDFKCDELRGMACRKGWLRALNDQGWYPIHEVIGCKVKQKSEVTQ